MSSLILDNPNRGAAEAAAYQFCSDFCSNASDPKYILGRNLYAASVAKHIKIDGFVDDYTSDNGYLGCPVIKLADVPKNALVLNVAGGRPLSARRRLDEAGLRNLDYFAFYKLSGFPLTPMRFNEGFEEEFNANKENYAWIYGLFCDENSRHIFKKLVSFRLDYDIEHLAGFTWREDVQYFENFLSLRTEGETFIDIGGYNGYTSLEFIKRCPGYKSIHIFEPVPNNYQYCLESLHGIRDVHIYNTGLFRNKATLKLDMQGSASRVSQDGTVAILVDRLDDVLSAVPTFIKMDIEGEEIAALEGARHTILAYHPRLAISVYHRPGDFWKIPQLILSIREDYDVCVRHYTECIYETVMFFIPRP